MRTRTACNCSVVSRQSSVLSRQSSVVSPQSSVLDTKTPENERHRNEERWRSRIDNDLDSHLLPGAPASVSRGLRYCGVTGSPNGSHHVGNQSGEARIDVRPVCDL